MYKQFYQYYIDNSSLTHTVLMTSLIYQAKNPSIMFSTAVQIHQSNQTMMTDEQKMTRFKNFSAAGKTFTELGLSISSLARVLEMSARASAMRRICLQRVCAVLSCILTMFRRRTVPTPVNKRVLQQNDENSDLFQPGPDGY